MVPSGLLGRPVSPYERWGGTTGPVCLLEHRGGALTSAPLPVGGGSYDQTKGKEGVGPAMTVPSSGADSPSSPSEPLLERLALSQSSVFSGPVGWGQGSPLRAVQPPSGHNHKSRSKRSGRSMVLALGGDDGVGEEWLMAKAPGSLGKQPGPSAQARQPSWPVGRDAEDGQGQDIWLLATAALLASLRRKPGPLGGRVMLWFAEAWGEGSWPTLSRARTL